MFQKLFPILARLRGPGGCPWDRAQTLESMRSCLLEETWEVLDTINRGDTEHLKEELGDLLLNVLLLADIADAKHRPSQKTKEPSEPSEPSFDEGHFLAEVVAKLCQKLVSRHPHVFASETADSPKEALAHWQKAKERQASRTEDSAQAALLRAFALQKKAAKAGFDWPSDTASQQIGEKVQEELAEFYEETDRGKKEEELGDILFSVVNLGRVHSINPELALMRSSDKFRRRFESVEANSKGRTLSEMNLEELWQQAKQKHP